MAAPRHPEPVGSEAIHAARETAVPTTRITPIDPPYPDDLQAAFDTIMH